MHINSAEDLEPKSLGFANRGAESINIIGNVLSDILNGFGEALSGIAKTGISGTVSFSQANRGDQLEARRLANVNDPNPEEAIADAIRVQHDIDKDVPQI